MTSKQIGFISGITASLIWGLFPLYWKLLEDIPAIETLMHRIVWSVPTCLILILVTSRWQAFKEVLQAPKLLGWLFLSTCLISINWGTYIWAVANDQVLDASLGYFMNPLVNVGLGMLLFHEKLRPLQIIAIVIAVSGIAITLINKGYFPLVSIGVSLSFGFYGCVKKVTPVGPITSLAVEVLLISPVAIAFLGYLAWQGDGFFMKGDLQTHLILMAAGLITAVPLMLYINGARRLPFIHSSIMMYLAPIGLFLLGYFVYHEPVTMERGILFGFTIVAVALFVTDLIRQYREVGRPSDS